MRKKPLTAEQIRAKTPATEKWVQDALKYIGEPALDSVNNAYAYNLRALELAHPVIAGFLIPLFARSPQWPWWKSRHVVLTYQNRP
jgi:hypothetical protein